MRAESQSRSRFIDSCYKLDYRYVMRPLKPLWRIELYMRNICTQFLRVNCNKHNYHSTLVVIHNYSILMNSYLHFRENIPWLHYFNVKWCLITTNFWCHYPAFQQFPKIKNIAHCAFHNSFKKLHLVRVRKNTLLPEIEKL